MKLGYWKWEDDEYVFGFLLLREEIEKIQNKYDYITNWWDWKTVWPLLITQTPFVDHKKREIPGGHYLVYTNSTLKMKELDLAFFKIPRSSIHWPKPETVDFAVNTMGFKLT